MLLKCALNPVALRYGSELSKGRMAILMIRPTTVGIRGSIGKLRFSTKSEGLEELDRPIKFTTSKASEWKAKNTFGGTIAEDTPAAQMYSIAFSLTVFMLYFGVFREENDFDEGMDKPLWVRVPGLELQQLRVLQDYNRQKGIDNTQVNARLKELEKEQEAV